MKLEKIQKTKHSLLCFSGSLSTVVGDEKLTSREDRIGPFFGSLSTVVGDEKLTSREDRIGPLFMYVQCDEDTFLKVDEVSKTEAQAFNVFN